MVVDGLLCDPYFASVVAGPAAEERERIVGVSWSRRTDEPDGRWTLEVGNGRFGRTLLYRVLAPVVDPDDVAALCAISVTHTGAPPRPLAFVYRRPKRVEAFTHGDGTTATRTWTWNGPDDIWAGDLDQAEHPDWAAADRGLRHPHRHPPGLTPPDHRRSDPAGTAGSDRQFEGEGSSWATRRGSSAGRRPAARWR